MISYGSVCSGIEAVSAAWSTLGWRCAWLSEIEKFPSAVLAARFPETPNLGDMTTLAEKVGFGEVEAPDILVGGTPCQSFSVAGLRKGLNDARGNLTLSFVELADEIDKVRAERGQAGAVILWENVPGVLSDKTNAFGCLLAGLAGLDAAPVPVTRRWPRAGRIEGRRRRVAWAILDAQYFGVPQRRRRVFVLAVPAPADAGEHPGAGGIDPAEILAIGQGVRGDPSPRGESAQRVAGSLAARTRGGGGLGTDVDLDGGLVAFGGNRTVGPLDVATACRAKGGTGHGDFESETFVVGTVAGALSSAGGNAAGSATSQDADSGLLVAHSLRADGFDASEDGTGRGVPLVAATLSQNHGNPRVDDAASFIPFDTTQITHPENRCQPKPGDPCHPLAAGAHPPAIAFSSKDHGADAGSLSPTLRAAGPPAAAFSITPMSGQGAQLRACEIDTANALDSTSQAEVTDRGVRVVQHGVRRLTPTECERLQGFPDGWTRIPWPPRRSSTKNLRCPDGPRYKALGNSMAVVVMRWLGERIAQVLRPTRRKLDPSRSAGQCGPKLELDRADLNKNERAVLDALSRKTLTIAQLADACFSARGLVQSNSWTRNALRRLVRAGLVEKVERGVYRKT